MSKNLYAFILILFVLQKIGMAQNTTSSVLAEGDIYKLAIQESAMYKIDYEFLQNMDGFDVDQINPTQIQLYSNPGGLIPQLISEPRIDDLNPINIKIVGENDGSFDPGDYILFYAEGPDKYNLSSGQYTFEKNYYDPYNYVFLKTGVTQTNRINQTPSVLMAEQTSNETESIKRHEIDRINLLAEFGGTQGSGKQWFGESFTNNNNQDFSASFVFPNLVPGTVSQVKALLSSRSLSTSKFNITIDGQTYTSNHAISNTGNIESIYSKSNTISTEVTLNNTNPSVTIDYIPQATDSEGWLDYLEILTKEYLRFQNNPMFIVDRASMSFNSYGYNIDSDRDLEIWDITDMADLSTMETSFRNGQVAFSFETDNVLRSFIAFDENAVEKSPVYVSKVSNQNLHAIERADYIMVYHPDFAQATERLANHRVQHDGLNVRIVNIFDIYNEFGGGRSEATALRDFVRMMHVRDPNFRYLLLMGDASYDFRGINQNIAYQNFVPTYETDESLHPVESFPSDDFFALLSNNEGDKSLDGALDIGVGRIPCKTADEADDVVNKIIHYDTSNKCLGAWRLNTGYCADDQDKLADLAHVRDQDEIARETFEAHPEFIQQKVYWDAFTQVSTPGGQRYPDANAALNENIQKGQLVLSYLGHGGPKGWSQERVLQIPDINSWTNLDKMPVIITATCSFTGFDEPNFVSAGENAILNPRGGAIALFTTVRAVYSSSNKRLTKEVYREIFNREDGKRLRIGDIIRNSKNANSADTTRSNSRKFLLMGDPALTLATPKHFVNVSSINGNEINEQSLDTLGALDRATIAGTIVDGNGTRVSTFNGEIFITVFDKPTPRRTLDNDNVGSTFGFDVMKNVLYKGSATVTNGEFDIDIIIPKDINFDFGLGHVSFYASDNVSEDAGGYYDQLVIGGTSETAITDNEGPEIKIYLDDRSFEFGGTVRKDPLLILDLADENGINLSSTSIGHDITASLEEKNSNTIILNDFFTPTIDQLGSGTVEYQLSELEPGFHSIYIKAWDILNNSSEAYTEFFVAENLEGFISNVFNYPNPFTTSTHFTFEHDLSNANIDIAVSIYTLTGKLVKTVREQRLGAGYRVDDIFWNGRDDYENKLARGIYIYKINISSSELNLSRESNFQKLVVLN